MTSGAATSLAAPVRRLAQAVDARLRIIRRQTTDEQTALSLIPQRWRSTPRAGLGTVALLLATLGIYGGGRAWCSAAAAVAASGTPARAAAINPIVGLRSE